MCALAHTAMTVNAASMEGCLMRKKYLSSVFVVAMAVGCVVPIYDSSRDIRTKQLIFVSEGLRHIPRIWERIWGLEMPDLATPYRTHGGVI